MEAFALSLIIGTAFILSGIRLKGIARWALGAMGLVVFLVTASRFCEGYSNVCSLDGLFGGRFGPSPVPSPTFAPPPVPSYSPAPVPSPTPTYYPTPVPSPTPTYYPTPVPSPTPTYYPVPAPVPSPRPTYYPTPPRPNPQPSPDLSACTDGNCTCVNYKCLW